RTGFLIERVVSFSQLRPAPRHPLFPYTTLFRSLFYRFKDTWFGLFKSASFGGTITLVGCIVGLGTRGGAEGVGKSTMRAVVYSAVLLLVLDAFWALVLLR